MNVIDAPTAVGYPTTRLKFVASKIGSGKTPKGGAEAYVPEGVPFIRSQNVQFSGLSLDDVVFIDKETHEEMRSSAVLPNDVLFNITGASIGRCCVVPNKFRAANVNQHVCIVRPSEHIDPYYLNYVLASDVGQTQLAFSQDGVSREGLNFESVGDFTIPQRSIDEQRAIARFLDRETSDIDHLIAAKERWLRLLAEKRHATITHAVTGRFRLQFDRYQRLRLDGELDYPVIPLKYVASISGGATPNRGQRDNWGGDIPWVSPKDMKTTTILNSQEHITELGLRVASLDLLPEKRLLLVVRGMILAHTLPVALNSVPVTINQDMRAISFDVSILPEFALLYFQGFSLWLLTQVTESAHGTKKLDTEVIREMPIVRFPLSVQEAIVNGVARETTTISQMEDVTRKTIHLLMERRAALISAAVTGQISTAGAHE